MKRSFFQAAVVSILLYGCTTWTLTWKWLEKKLDGNYTRMLWAILNKSWRQHPTRHQLYGHRPPITKTIQVRWTRYAGHCWRSRDELISDVLLWTPTYGRAKAGRLVRTYIQQLCEDTGCSPEDLPEAMNDTEKWRERIRGIRASGTTWGWWWLIPKKWCPGNDNADNEASVLEIWVRRSWIPQQCDYSQVHRVEAVVPTRIPSMDQIDLFKNSSNSIGSGTKKFAYEKNYTKNENMNVPWTRLTNLLA